MTDRLIQLHDAFLRWLARYIPPKHLTGTAIDDEATALFDAVQRFAPQTGHLEWLAKCLCKMDDKMTYPIWPMKSALIAVFTAMSKKAVGPTARPVLGISEAQILANNMNKNHTVCEALLFGPDMWISLRQGLITAELRASYVKDIWIARRDSFSLAAADQWLCEQERRFETFR